jgi:protein SCO1/2
MRKSQKIITTVLWSFLVLTMVAVVGRGMWAGPDQNSTAATGIRLGSDAPIEDGLPILYDAPRFSLTDQDDKPFGSEQLTGQVWVAAFIFTNCPDACPMMTQKMAALQQSVPSKNVKLVSFSVDPQRDTPAVLKQYAARFKADESRWHFLTGKSDDIFAAAAGLNLAASPARGDKPIDHAEQFLLIDAKGRVRGIYHSKHDEDLQRLKIDAAKLAGS